MSGDNASVPLDIAGLERLRQCVALKNPNYVGDFAHLEAGDKAGAVALHNRHRKVLGNDDVGNQLGDIRLGNQVIMSGKIT